MSDRIEINIPTGPLDEAPWGAIRYDRPEPVADAHRAAITAALNGVKLGAYDERLVDWLAGWDVPTIVTICSWLHRVRAVALDGQIVLDEPTELGLPYGDGGDLLAISEGAIVLYPRGCDEFIQSPSEAREMAAHLVAMANALDAAKGDAR